MTPTHLPGRVAIPSLPEQTRTPPSPTALESFNTAPADEVRRALLSCLRSPRWADRIADHRPYPDVDSLLAASDEAAYDLTPGDLTQALAGETLPVLPKGAYGAAHTALSAASAAYEARFGHAFVICVDGLTPNEALDHALAGIRSRLTNDPEEERVVAAEELRRLARGRLIDVLRGARNCATSHNAPTLGKYQDTSAP
ncbi:OHCU decarboxylase [Streptomyces viridochromogenes]|uniref:2-oxo-4-hydroxy-4-carboxy-5-ureidoimidazoline decarboxylase n=1 Tax=Streptomyces viridochromogenes TaxID=1938 RepID=A0A0J7YW07_STRVR|nr:2-oxo-4-hydroxy-4-carboxy-5-ureidoimidazoline decarboxylase [Streptomyces viridochromogenes]KMS67642.1 OHCU decarboxylase [Streptomyces viridochromogenes]KOG15270.1 OHCU decarboxylase [Streptomyces viridochromogenes]KOG24537.1 OHCU decarboxylase [Streptomyces viridochromogenes]